MPITPSGLYETFSADIGPMSQGLADPWITLDGRLAAPAGTPQFPTLVNAFVASGPARRLRVVNGSYAVNVPTRQQPPWMIAGVDYPVGIDRNLFPTNAALADPASLPTSAGSSTLYYTTTTGSYGGPQVTIDGSTNVTLNGYDLSLHNGVNILIKNTFTGTCTVQNCYFQIGSNLSPMYISQATANQAVQILQYCELNCNGSSDGFQIGANASWGAGTITCMYNFLDQWSGRAVEVNGSSANSSSINATIKYNVLYAGNWTSGEHADGLQLLSGSQSCVAQFNTCFQPFATSSGKPGAQNSFLRASDNIFSNMVGVEFGYNTCQGQGHTGHSLNTGDGNPFPALGTVFQLGTAGTTCWCDTSTGSNVVQHITAFGSTGVLIDPSSAMTIPPQNPGGHLIGLFITSNDTTTVPAGTTVTAASSSTITLSAAPTATSSQVQLWVTNDRQLVAPYVHDNFVNIGDVSTGTTTNVTGPILPVIVGETYPNGPPFWNITPGTYHNNINMFDGSFWTNNP